KLNNCSANTLKKYLASQYNVECNTLDATIKPVMKCAMDRNILSNLGHTAKISETKRRRKSSGGKKRKEVIWRQETQEVFWWENDVKALVENVKRKKSKKGAAAAQE
ncbi:hypothetical protein CDAR_236511, partial [Caerostris darwini]